MGSGQLQLSASRLLVPARHRLGRLSGSAGRQPPWILLPPPHGTHHPCSAGQTALSYGTRKCPSAIKAAWTATPSAGRYPCTPGRWLQFALQSTGGPVWGACPSMRHVAGAGSNARLPLKSSFIVSCATPRPPTSTKVITVVPWRPALHVTTAALGLAESSGVWGLPHESTS